MKKDLILVVGASGLVGSELVKILKAQGEPVRTTTSKKGAASGDSVYVNLTTGEGIRDAFEGVEKAFLLSPGGYADQYKMLSPLIQEAKRRGLKKVVLMTAMGANAVETSPMRRAEIELEKSGLKYNILRPNWFMENFSTFWVQGIKEQGKIQLPAGSAKTSFISTKDISAVAAKLLTSDRFDNQAFELSGPEDLTHADVTRLISEATGKKVVYEEIEPQVLRGGLLQAGLPEDYTDFLLMILGFLKEGYNAGVRSTVKEILGREARGFGEYATEMRGAWV